MIATVPSIDFTEIKNKKKSLFDQSYIGGIQLKNRFIRSSVGD